MELNEKALRARICELFDYNPNTGLFIRKTTIPNGRALAGSVAGTLNGHGYISIKIDLRFHAAHRLAWLYMTGRIPKHQVDHINGIRTDNRFSNLREATNSQNQANAKRPSHNTSGFKGVSFNKASGKWQANIRVNGRQIHLGSHKTPENAHRAYQEAARFHHGEFARAS